MKPFSFYGFEFRPFLTIAVLISIAILVSLGQWQVNRSAWKTDLITAVNARIDGAPITISAVRAAQKNNMDLRYQPVTVSGSYDHDKERHLFGTLNGKPGYYIFTPLQTTDAGTIIVNRGFAPQNAKHRDQRRDGLINSPVEVIGLLRQPEKRAGLTKIFAPNDQPTENIYYTRDPALLYPDDHTIDYSFYVDSKGLEAPLTLPQGGTTRIAFHNRHIQYALTWFGLAATLIGVFLVFSRKSARA